MFREGYRDTSLDKGTGPVQGGVQWVQPCTGEGGGGVYRPAQRYRLV